MSQETKILWLPASDYESRSLFDYESNTFGTSVASRNPAGVRIDANTALNSTIVLACVRVLAEGLATLPLHVYARSKNGGKEVARGHPLYRILHDRPNEWQTSFEWREMQMLHLGIYGQSFNEIVRDKRDIISALVPLHPSRMRVESIETGNLRYTYQEENGRMTVYPQDQIMHIRWMSNDGVNGMVPIELARDAIGLARACEIHGASFFANGARPGLVLSTENTLSAEAAELLRTNWERVHRGPDRAQKTAVLTGGLKPVEFGNTNQESQFLETRRFQIEEICRLYRVPGSLVGDLSRSNFANIEQQSIDFVQYTLVPWLRRFESAFGRDLLGEDEGHFVEFDTRGLMRGDATTRASYYNTLWNLGVASVNELRAWENLDPVEGGDARFAPLNMQTLEAAAKQGQEKEEPPAPTASVNELVAVLSQVAGGAVAPESAKAIMAAAFPSLPPELAGQILAGVSGPPPEKPPEPEREKPAADVGGLVAILAQVKDGSLTTEAAIAAMGSVYPELPSATAQQIVDGVNQPPEPPPPEKQPAADVDGLLAILGQVSQGAVTPEAATTILAAVFPKMPPEMAKVIVAGAQAQQQEGGAPPEGGEPPPEAEAEPDERASPGAISEGDFVSWNSAGGRARGRVDHVMDYGTLDVPGTDFKIDASEEDPAALITVYEKVTGGWRETDTQVGHKVATLTRIEPLESPADERAFCPGASPPDNSCPPSNKGEGKPGGADTKDPEFKEWFEGSIAKNDDGSPMTIWRGGKERESFDPSAAVAGGGEYGIFVTPREATAKAYAGDGGVHAYYVNVKNPLYVEGKYEISAGQLTKSDIDRLREQGYDSIAVVDKPGSTPLRDAHEIVLFQDNQIVSAERVSSASYGMEYSPRNERVVAKAREVSDAGWNQIPVEDVPHGTVLQANEKTLKLAPIDKVVSGREPFRQNYVAKLWRDGKGDLHIVDGHHRVAMYHALGKDMPARIMTQADYDAMTGGSRAFCPGVSPPDNSCSPANKGDGSEKGSGSKKEKTPMEPKDVMLPPESKGDKPKGSSDVSVKSLQAHADKVAGGSDLDGSLKTPDFPDGAVVPRDIAKLDAYHAAKKAELAERINVPSDKSAQVANAATTVEELLADAREVAPAYKRLVEQAAKESGSEASLGKVDPKDPSFEYLNEHADGTHMLKAPRSLEPKVGRVRAEENYGPDVTDATIVSRELKDAVRGTLISDTPESLGSAVRSVRQQAERDGLAVTIKNRFEDNAKTGYAAVHMTLQMQTPSGRPVMTELQFHLRQAYDGNQGSPKDNSHGLYKPDPKTNRITSQSAAAQKLIWSRVFEDVPPPPAEGERSQRAWCPGASPPDNSCPPSNKGGGGKSSGGGKGKKGDKPSKGKSCPAPCHEPNVQKDSNGDGVTDVARVGVPANEVPPPPKVGRLPNLNEHERAVESSFAEAFEKNPDQVAAQYRELEVARGNPPTFGTDDAKQLTEAWNHPDPEIRAENRATLNTALHQTANAVAKRAFLQHLDTLEPGDEVLVTVGGCGAGKGYALKNVPEAMEMRNGSKAVWDSAGDQNATENPWIQSEAEARGLRVNYVYVHADPETQWADPNRGVVARAANPSDGRMVDAKVFADSYAIGARNHQAFYESNRDNPSARFSFLDNTGAPSRIDGIPQSALNLDSGRLAAFAERTVARANVPPRVKSGALAGKRIWRSKKSKK
jgi:HK97 family phage portal protein